MRRAIASDLSVIASCHQKAFPNSVPSLLGVHFISAMFKWYLQADNRFMYCIIENNKCVGYVGGYIVTEAEKKGSGSGMVQSGFYEGMQAVLKNPTLLFHPKLIRQFSFILKNIVLKISSYFKSTTKNIVQQKTQNEVMARLVVIGVDPDKQGYGNGSLLIREFEKNCKEKGVHTIGLSVRSENKQAIQAYKSNGWNIAEIGISILKMEKKL